jgi:hypothetical protein
MIENVRAAPAAETDLPTRIVSYAWGDAYVEELLDLAIPALLAPGNLPYVASQVNCDLTLVTEQRLFAKVAAHPAIAKARQLCPVRLIGLDDLVTKSDQYGMALTYALHRAFADLGPSATDYWLMFLNADFILADGSLRNLLGHLRRGERVVASPSYCAVRKDALRELRQRLTADPTQLVIAPRELARIILRHRHNTIRGKTINQDAFHLYHADQFYWACDDDTLLGHQMPVSIVGMRPQRFLVEPNSFWDHGLISEFCPSADVKVLGDSDEFLMLELRGGSIAADEIFRGQPNPRDLGARMNIWVTPYQASFANQPLTLHAGDLRSPVEHGRQELAGFVSQVLSYAGVLPSHLDHAQWNYHWPSFTKSRHAFLSSRLGFLTVNEAPPQSMSETDKLWWRLDGATKSLARQKRLAGEERDREDELAKAAQELGWNLADRAYASVMLQSGSALLHGPGQCARVAADERYHDLVGPLEAEQDRLQNAYDALLRPRVKSAGPVVQFIAGTQEPRTPRRNRVGALIWFLYYRLFGRWPRVTMINPSWAAVRPLLQAIATAKAEGARDAMIVSDDLRIARELADLPGTVACITKAGFSSGQFRFYIEPRPQFDLFLVDLNGEDLLRLHSIVEIAKPYIRPDCTIIAFHMNQGRALEGSMLPRVNGKMVFAGSEASMRAMSSPAGVFIRALSGNAAGVNRCELPRFRQVLPTFPLQVLQFWRANRAEAAAAKQGRMPAAGYRTSVTITTHAPWLVGEGPFDRDSVDSSIGHVSGYGG